MLHNVLHSDLRPADGVLFQGNLRGDPAAAYQKLTTRRKVRLAALRCTACACLSA
jgi:hypothetical protein